MAVPRGRVAGAEEERLGLGIVGAAQPRGAAAGLPQIARPRSVLRAGHGAVLAVQRAHVAFDRRAGPDQLAGLGIARLDGADHAELTAGIAGDDLAVDDQRGGGHGIAGLIVGDLLVPDDLAGILVERHEAGVERAEVNLVATDGGAPVHHVAARHDAFGKAGVVLPLLVAGAGIDREEPGIGPVT